MSIKTKLLYTVLFPINIKNTRYYKFSGSYSSVSSGWDVTLRCSVRRYQHFEGTCCFHLQDRSHGYQVKWVCAFYGLFLLLHFSFTIPMAWTCMPTDLSNHLNCNPPIQSDRILNRLHGDSTFLGSVEISGDPWTWMGNKLHL